MKLVLNTGEGEDTLNARRIFLLAGRLDWTDRFDVRHKMALPYECTVSAKEPGGLYVRVDRPTTTAAGYASEVRIERDFIGSPVLTVDDVVLVPDAGFSLYVGDRSTGPAGAQLPEFATVART
jgi:hypothetical protein